MPLMATCVTLRLRPFLLSFAVLVLGLATALRAGAAALDWSVEIAPDGELFPVLDLSQAPPKSASAGAGNGLVIVRVRGDDEPHRLRVVVTTSGLRTAAVVEADIGPHATIELRPRLDWNVEWLRALKSPNRQAVGITLETSGHLAETREVLARVHPLDDALYFVREGKDRIDLGWVFAAYVNPRDPVVETIVADARDIDPDFDRPPKDAADSVRKARAIWAMLTRHGLRYAAGDPALSRGPTIYSQRIRLIGDVWNERRANCLDGSVLIASVLERIGIPAFLVLVPGHAFVGYHADRDRVEFLETTLLGDGRARSSAIDDDAAAVAANFEAARGAGLARWRRVAGRFDRRHGPDYALIDIGTARSYGIIPIGAHGDDGDRDAHGGASAARAIPRRSSSQ
jgi:hypothetical protein